MVPDRADRCQAIDQDWSDPVAFRVSLCLMSSMVDHKVVSLPVDVCQCADWLRLWVDRFGWPVAFRLLIRCNALYRIVKARDVVGADLVTNRHVSVDT
jgi:hypothetical protein